MKGHRRNSGSCGKCWAGICVYDSQGRELSHTAMKKLQTREADIRSVAQARKETS